MNEYDEWPKRRTVAFCWTQPLIASNGGIERVTQRLMGGLLERNFNCIFIRHDIERDRFLYDEKDAGDLGAFLNNHKVDTLVNQNAYSSRMTEILDGIRWHGRYIVCHHNEPLFLQKLYDLRRVISEFLAPKISFKMRSTWFVRLLGYPFWRVWSHRKIARTQAINYRRSDRYVLLSPSFLPIFSQLVGRSSTPKAVAIPNPLSFNFTPEEARGFAKRKEALIVARLNEREKRISYALRAWQVVEAQGREDWTLKIIGFGPDSAALKDMADRMGLKHVVFLGRMDPLLHYQSASIFLMTSRVEGWGLTLTEAMQTGVVPIAFDAYDSLRDIIDHEKTGLIVKDGDIAAYSDAILQLIENAAHRQTMATNALTTCQKYRMEAVLDQWEAIL